MDTFVESVEPELVGEHGGDDNRADIACLLRNCFAQDWVIQTRVIKSKPHSWDHFTTDNAAFVILRSALESSNDDLDKVFCPGVGLETVRSFLRSLRHRMDALTSLEEWVLYKWLLRNRKLFDELTPESPMVGRVVIVRKDDDDDDDVDNIHTPPQGRFIYESRHATTPQAAIEYVKMLRVACKVPPGKRWLYFPTTRRDALDILHGKFLDRKGAHGRDFGAGMYLTSCLSTAWETAYTGANSCEPAVIIYEEPPEGIDWFQLTTESTPTWHEVVNHYRCRGKRSLDMRHFNDKIPFVCGVVSVCKPEKDKETWVMPCADIDVDMDTDTDTEKTCKNLQFVVKDYTLWERTSVFVAVVFCAPQGYCRDDTIVFLRNTK